MRLVVRPAEFAELVTELRGEQLIAVDTEAASFHRYQDRVYLLQLSSRTETWIVDPLEVEGLPGLDRLLSDPGIELIFHDADYDLRLLFHEFGYRASRVFDTRIAAQFLNETGIGLAALLEKYFQVKLDKRFQRADWSSRPLSPEMLDYAATDTQYLPALRDLLRQRLIEAGRLEWAEEEFSLLTEVGWPEPEPPEQAALGTKGARALTPRELAVFRELYVWREEVARTLNRAPFRVVGNDTLFALARGLPRNPAALDQVRGLGKEIRDRRRAEILSAIQRGISLPEDQLPRFSRPPRHRYDPRFEERLEKLRAIRAAESARLELPPGTLAPNWLLESVARAAPRDSDSLASVPGLRRWQQKVLGDRFLAGVS
jgi:ribonuclease D